MPTTTATYTNLPGTLGGPLSQRRSGQSSFYLPDHQGNTRQLTNVAESVTDSLLTDAWGAAVASTGATVNPFKAFGQWGYFRESPSRFYVRARWYAAELGRWLSKDPFEADPVGMTLYAYCQNEPEMILDPSGLACQLRRCFTEKGSSLQGRMTCFTHSGVFCNPGHKGCKTFTVGMTGSWPHVCYECGPNRNDYFRDKNVKDDPKYWRVECGDSLKIQLAWKKKCSVTIQIIDVGPGKGNELSNIVDLHPLPTRKLWECLFPNRKFPGCLNVSSSDLGPVIVTPA